MANIKEGLKELERKVSKIKHLIGISVLVMLILLSYLAYMDIQKLNEIKETGGFTDNKVKCVCTQEAWDTFMQPNQVTLNDLNISVGLEHG